VGVAEIVRPEVDTEIGGLDRGFPDVITKPTAGDVTVGVDGATASGGVFAARATAGAVVSVDVLAVLAAALASGVAAQDAVAVAPVGFDVAEGFRGSEDP